MKKKILIFGMLLAGAVALYAVDNVLDYLNASTDGTRITVEWKRNDEHKVQQYVVEKSLNGNKFEEVHAEKSKGVASSYRWIDENPFYKAGDSKSGGKVLSDNKYSYRIQILYNDNTKNYSDPVNVSQKTNSIRRTWGMIKEMFR